MSNEFKLPDIGEGLAEGEIVKWLVSVGDEVEEDQPLVEVMTDKATVEIPSPRRGTIDELRAAEGDVVEIGTTILVFGDAAEAEDGGEAGADGDGEGDRDGDGGDAADGEGDGDEIAAARRRARAERSAAEAEGDGDGGAAEAGDVLATPATRKLARELDVDLTRVEGSGRKGRITKDDVMAFAGEDAGDRAEVEGEPAAADEAAEAERERQDAPVPGRGEARRDRERPRPADGEEERVPLRGLRRTIAERMVEAMTKVPHYTYVEEADMTEIVKLRQEAREMAEERGVKLTYLPFIIRALVLALKKYPYMNASLDEDAGEIVLKRFYNVGVATATDDGLIVPVIKGADRLGIFELAEEIERLSSAARDGSIEIGDLKGGTFTITSVGAVGGVIATPIINLPEVAILGVTAIRERPMVRDGDIVKRHMVNLSLSLDHRVVDGMVAALFVRDLVKLLEDPKLQLLASL